MDDHAPGPGGGEEKEPGIVERLQVARAANWEFLRASFNACGEEPPPANGLEPSGLGEAWGLFAWGGAAEHRAGYLQIP